MTDLLRDELASLNPYPLNPLDGEPTAPAVPAHVRERVMAEVHATPARATTWRSRRLFPLAFAGLLVVASGAVAAAVALHTGKPAPKDFGLELGRWGNGPGQPIAGSAKLLSIRATDPDGGPPWALRVFRTQRGAACWQVGRVVNGQLGVIGRDDVLDNDGLFHPLHWQANDCRPLDGAGHLFAFQSDWGLANGTFLDQRCALVAGPGSKAPLCPAADRRFLWFGFLGPQARSISIDGGSAIPVSPDEESAFLHVERLPDPQHAPLRRITATYADGTTHPVDDVESLETPVSPNASPRPPGFVTPERLLPSAAKIRSAVRLTTHRYGINVIYRVQFRARTTPRLFGANYLIQLDGPGSGPTCAKPLHFAGFNLAARAGHIITANISPAIAGRWNHPWCPGIYRGRVVLHDRAHTVGTFSFRVRE